MLRRLVSVLPPGVLRFVGRLQFKSAVLRPLIEAVARRIAAVDGVIKYGVGAGLKFNASGGAVGYLLGTSEIEEQELLAKLLKPGDTFYDIGANVGFYSTIAARLVGPRGYVYAFEPFGPSAETAKRNATLNGFTNVSVIEAAVSAEEGVAWLNTESGPVSTQYHVVRDGSKGSIPVQVTSVDHYVATHNVPGPNVVMIDVEGGEIEVLRGMLTTLKKYRPIIMCEVHWTGGLFRSFVDQYLLELGYQASTYAGNQLPSEATRYHALVLPGHRL